MKLQQFVALIVAALCFVSCSTTSNAPATPEQAETPAATTKTATQNSQSPSQVTNNALGDIQVEEPAKDTNTIAIDLADQTKTKQNSNSDDSIKENLADTSATDAPEARDIGDLVRCEAEIQENSQVYTAEALGPTLEEARDNTVDEACAVPCADKLPENAQDSEREDLLDACIDKCGDEVEVIAVQCWQHGESIYTEGAWSATHDAPPTNGAES